MCVSSERRSVELDEKLAFYSKKSLTIHDKTGKFDVISFTRTAKTYIATAIISLYLLFTSFVWIPPYFFCRTRSRSRKYEGSPTHKELVISNDRKNTKNRHKQKFMKKMCITFHSIRNMQINMHTQPISQHKKSVHYRNAPGMKKTREPNWSQKIDQNDIKRKKTEQMQIKMQQMQMKFIMNKWPLNPIDKTLTILVVNGQFAL